MMEGKGATIFLPQTTQSIISWELFQAAAFTLIYFTYP